MGLFGFGKNNASVDISKPSAPILDLTKGDILDLSKEPAASFTSMKVSAGWDVNKRGGSDYDLDLCAFLLNDEGSLIRSHEPVVYYGKKDSTPGIRLDGDNLTGEGDGDDENIFVSLNKVPSDCQRIVFCVVIYEGSARHQQFGDVKNAYVRLVNTEDKRHEQELCRYSLSEDGGNNTAVHFCELDRTNGNWTFKAVGDYMNATISDIKRKFN